MFLTILTLITALTISAVAIYYSVAGLAAIFAAAVIPILIMGTTLEVAKLVTTVWLHRYWREAVWWLKTYLTVAVVILMFITSMGIFGFLSKAHIDQTTASQESVAQVERMTTEIARQTELIERAESRIKQIETGGVGGQSNIQNQIDQEQQRIAGINNRVQPAIDEQQKIIDSQTKLFQDQITKIDEQIARLQQLIDSKDIAAAQALVGTRPDGNWGPATARSIQAWQDARAKERADSILKLEQANANSTIVAARQEIQRIRRGVEGEIAESNRLINRLRDQLGKTDTDEVEKLITEQRERVRAAQTEIDSLTEKKYRLEGEYRKLEAEVGPVKYIAEFIYGNEADKNMLEEAVRWVIIIIIFVFDPLAVLLLLASQYSFEYHRDNRNRKRKSLDQLLEETPSLEVVEKPTYEQDDGPLTDVQIEQIKKSVEIFKEEIKKPEQAIDNIISTPVTEKKTKKSKQVKLSKSVEPIIDKVEILPESNLTVTSSLFDVVPEQTEIITDDVTQQVFHPDEQYVEYDGKLMSIEALRGLHPEMILPKTADLISTIQFGSVFPSSSKIGDIYVRSDVIPHRVYKFNGKKWMNVDKNHNSTYLQNDEYLRYLIEKIESKQYDVDSLTEFEQEAITEYLKK